MAFLSVMERNLISVENTFSREGKGYARPYGSPTLPEKYRGDPAGHPTVEIRPTSSFLEKKDGKPDGKHTTSDADVAMESFQVVVEIARDALVQMHHVLSHHVMSLTGIDEKVRLGSGILTSTQKGKGVLRNTDGVVITDDDLQTPLEVARLAKKTG